MQHQRCPALWFKSTPRLIVAFAIASSCADPEFSSPPPAIDTSSEALIRDALHNDGTSGFYFLAPMMPADPATLPNNTSLLDSLEVRIDEIDPLTEQAIQNIAVYSSTQPPPSCHPLAIEPARDAFVVYWPTRLYAVSPANTYRVRILSSGFELGFADLDLIDTWSEWSRVNHAEYVAWLSGTMLPIRFRVTHLDQCLTLDCDDGNPCTIDDCDAISGCFSTNAPDGGFAESTTTACGLGECYGEGSTECANGEVVDTCEPGEPAESDGTCDGLDEDCDGELDEDFESEETACGTGECFMIGETYCEDGEVIDTCEPAEPAEDDATCDFLDNDCDDEVDEDCVTDCSGAPPIPNEVEPNDSFAEAAPLALELGQNVSIAGFLDGYEDYDYAVFEVAPGETALVTARVRDSSGDLTSCAGPSYLALYDAQENELAYSDWGFFSSCPYIQSFGPLGPGLYYFEQGLAGDTSSHESVLDVRLSPLPDPEVEPNDEEWEATAVLANGPGFASFSGDIASGRDMYILEVPEESILDLRASIYGEVGDVFSCNEPISLRVADLWGEINYFDSGDGPGGCPWIDDVQLWPGTYYITVSTGGDGGEGGGECGECGCDGCGEESDGEGGAYVLELELSVDQSPAICGDGTVTGCEQCDGGQCCSWDCTLLSQGTVCSIFGTCAVGVCDGANNSCPIDTAAPAGTPCRGIYGACDVAEYCDGASLDCPSDQYVEEGFVCGPVQGPCDIEDTCSGVDPYCWDQLQPWNTPCRDSAGICDLADVCYGWSPFCFDSVPFESESITCRASAGSCDPAERCSPSSGVCPEDHLHSASTICRVSTAPCDAEERCTGEDSTCPSDQVREEGEVCRAPSRGSCDVAERCSAEGVCPADVLAAPGECEPEAHWVRTGALGAPAFATQVRIDADHNIFVAGGVLDTSPWSLNGYLANHERTDTFIAKYNEAGDLLWYRRNDAANHLFNRTTDINLDANGDILLLDQELTDYTETLTIRRISNADGSVLFELSGNTGIWSGRGSVHTALPAPSGEMFLLGSMQFNSCWGFDFMSPGLGLCTSIGGSWLAKYSATGVPLWYRVWSGQGSSFSTIFGHLSNQLIGRGTIYQVIIDGAGDILLAGSHTHSGVSVHKLSGEDGSDLWRYSSPSGFGFSELRLSADPETNDIYVAGRYSWDATSVDLGGGPLPAGYYLGYEAFVAKLSGANGGFQWSKRFGGTGTESGVSVKAGSNSDLVVSMRTNSPEIDFGGGPVNMAPGSNPIGVVFGLDGESGDYQWSRRVPAAIGDVALGSVVIAGSFLDTQDFDSTFVTATLYYYPYFSRGDDFFVYSFTPRETTFGNGTLDEGEICDSGACCTLFANFTPAGTICGRGGAMCTGDSSECVITCGNGQLDPGEACDQGVCCTDDCTPRNAFSSCREAANAWDIEDYCDGAGGDCPFDQVGPHGAICDDDDTATHSDMVNAASVCSGTTKTCPPDAPCVSYAFAGDGSPFCTPIYQAEGTPCSDGLSCVPGRSKVCNGFGLCVYAGGTP